VALFISGVARRNMQRMARTSTRAASAGISAAVAHTACDSISGASASGVADARFLAFAMFKASAPSLRWAQRQAWGHRRLTIRSSGRRSIACVLPNGAAGAAYLKR